MDQRLKDDFPLAARALQIDQDISWRANATAFRPDSDGSGMLAMDSVRGRVMLNADNSARGVQAAGIAGRQVAILDSQRASLGYDMSAKGLTAVAADRGVLFLGGRSDFALSAPLVIDSAGRPTNGAHWEVQRTSIGVTGIRLKIDDPRVTYPVAVIYSSGSAANVQRDRASLVSALAVRHLPTALFTGVITGTVRGADTGQALSGEFVQIYDANGNFAGFGVTDANGFYASQASGEGGGGLNTGTYYVVANSQGYVQQVYNNINCPAETCVPTSGTPVSVTNGATTSNINFNLPLAIARIAGTVVNSVTGGPISGVTVDIYDGTRTIVSATTSNGSGAWTAQLPGAGTYYAVTQNEIYAGYIDGLWNNIQCTGCDPTSGTGISATVGSTSGGITLKLTPNGGLIGGQIFNGTTPITGHVAIYNSAGVLVTTGDVDQGTLTYVGFNGLAAGNYYAVATSPGYHTELYSGMTCDNGCTVTTGTSIAVTTGQQATANFHLTRSFATVTGRVTSGPTGPGLGGVNVVFYDGSGNAVTSGVSDFNNGTYSVSVPVNADYYARVENTVYPNYADQLYNGIDCSRCDVTRGNAIHVANGNTISGINFPLNSNAASISGRVLDGRSAAAVSFALVQVYASNGELATYGFTDGSGNYTGFNELSAGTYYAVASASGYASELFDGIACSNCDPTTGTGITVTSNNSVSNINFTLTRQVARISGKVTDAVSTPLAGVTVAIYDSTGTQVGSALSGGSNGAYFVDLAASGTYYARTFTPNNSYSDQLFNGRSCAGGCTVTNGDPITATVGDETPNINFALPAANCAGLSMSPSDLPDTTLNASYSQQLTVSGGTGAVTFVVSSGALPTGLTLNAATGVISGTTTAGGSFTFTVTGTDTAGCAVARTYTIDVQNPATTTTLNVTPATTVTYGTSITLTATVSPAPPPVSETNPSEIVDFFQGTSLVASVTVVNGQASFSPGVLPVGAYDFFARYEGDNQLSPSTSATVHVVVNKATPVITWNNPANITYGTALDSTQLNATANVPGTFTYTPASGTLLNAGTYTLHVDFVPNDGANYNSTSKEVTLVVDKAPPNISIVGGMFTFDGNPHPATGTVTGVFNEDLTPPLTFTYNGSSNPPVSVGTYNVVGSYAGSTNYLADSATVTINIITGPASTSSISKNFSGQSIAGGTTIWFNAAFDTLSGVGTAPNTAVYATGQTITFTANGTHYTLTVPDAKVVFNDSSVTQPTTSYDSVNNLMVTQFPGQPNQGNGSAFLSGLAYTVPAGGLPGGIKSVTWTATFSTSNTTSNVGLHWKWAASVFTTFSSNYNALGIKPIDGQTSQYPNNDKAGTPENFKQFQSGNGATGGSYSSNANVTIPHQ